MAAEPTPRRSAVGRQWDRIANGPERIARLAADAVEAATMRAVVRTPSGSLTLRVGNRIELFRARTLLAKEPETIEWIDRTVGAGSVFYDIGANVGVYTLYAATRHASVRGVCFEPGAATFGRLCENLLDNGLGVRVLAFPLMASDDTGIAALALSDPRAGAAMHSRAELGLVESGPVQGSATVRIDDVVGPVGVLPSPTHIKIDVDGPELQVLRGASRVLASDTLEHVLVETDSRDADEIDRVLAEAGLVLATTGRMIGSGATVAQNRIYERR